MTHLIKVLPGRPDLLGESPVWDTRDQSLYWVDSKACLVQRYHPASGARISWTTPSEVGSIALGSDGGIVMALEDGFYHLDSASGKTTQIVRVEHPAPKMRLNDGRTDRQGRFLSGSMVLGRQDREADLYRLGHDGTVEQLASDVAISNSICFSPAGDRLYYGDSLAHCVYTYSYDTATGKLGPREKLIDTREFGSVPDGATVDAEGFLWVALVQVGAVGRFSPTGKLDRMINLPTTFVSCPCFGGPGLDVLYLTTISNSGHLLKATDENAGRLIEVRGLGVQGIAEVPYESLRPLGQGSEK